MSSFAQYLPARIERGFLRGLRPTSRKEIFVTAGKWRRFRPRLELADITKETIEEFNAWLLGGGQPAAGSRRQEGQRLLPGMEGAAAALRPLRPTTANKHLRNTHRVLRDAWATGAIDRVPPIEHNRVSRKKPRPIPVERLEAIYRACPAAVLPRLDCSPGDWWQALMCVALTCGSRRGALLSLRWDHVDWRGRAIWLEAEADKTGQDRTKPITDVAVAHLMRIRGARALVFAWPHCQRGMYRQWHAIQTAAGIPSQEHYGLHDLKKTCGTAHAAAGTSTHVLKEILDHASITTAEWYVQVSGDVRAAVEGLRLPAAFYGGEPGRATGSG